DFSAHHAARLVDLLDRQHLRIYHRFFGDGDRARQRMQDADLDRIRCGGGTNERRAGQCRNGGNCCCALDELSSIEFHVSTPLEVCSRSATAKKNPQDDGCNSPCGLLCVARSRPGQIAQSMSRSRIVVSCFPVPQGLRPRKPAQLHMPKLQTHIQTRTTYCKIRAIPATEIITSSTTVRIFGRTRLN